MRRSARAHRLHNHANEALAGPTEPNRPVDSLFEVSLSHDSPGRARLDQRNSPLMTGPGSAERFDQLFQANVLGLVRLAHLITGSNDVAEELVQDAFVELYRRWDTIERPDAYVRSAVINRSRSAIRRRALGVRVHRQVESMTVLPADIEPTDWQLIGALAHLSERQRVAVVLRYWADLSEKEIADELSCRPGTVKSLLARALERLREVVER
jgi:RNA polymerase sigma-70 factor (sigma-E family)